LYGRKVADSLEYPKGINTRKGVGKWLGEKSAMLLSNVVVNNAIHIFGYDLKILQNQPEKWILMHLLIC
jgi:hypothetical protein